MIIDIIITAIFNLVLLIGTLFMLSDIASNTLRKNHLYVSDLIVIIFAMPLAWFWESMALGTILMLTLQELGIDLDLQLSQACLIVGFTLALIIVPAVLLAGLLLRIIWYKKREQQPDQLRDDL